MKMITEEQYLEASRQHAQSETVINQYHMERLERFKQRLAENPVFTDDELIYSRETLCPCGYGLAYPKDCGPHHYWDCSAILKGIADASVKHTAKLPFAFYDVKSELDGRTTRGVFKPKPSAPSPPG